jgi:ribonuclease HI
LEKNRRRKNVVVYTDGACSPNPGPGGCSAVLLYEKHRKEIAEGYRLTTNNRMELMAVVRALESLNQKCSVQIFTDSRYVRDAFERGWIKKWKSNGWKTRLREDVLNTDLWTRLCELCQVHDCVFHWIKGHDLTKENIRCDELAVAAGKKPRLAVDHGYEKTRRLRQNLFLPQLPDASGRSKR